MDASSALRHSGEPTVHSQGLGAAFEPHALPEEVEDVRQMAQRAGAKITEASHVVIASDPDAVTDVILEAAFAVEPAGSWARK